MIGDNHVIEIRDCSGSNSACRRRPICADDGSFAACSQAAIISLSAFFGSADAGSAAEFRTLKITHGQFEQSEITAPAGEPLILDVELFGSQDVTVSIPKLGIEPTAVPANPVRIGSVHE